MALELLTNQADYQKYSPWYNVRRVEWVDTAELEELFTSESLETYYGSFIEQRYIDYLSNHLDDIGEIHWRKFEGLTGEFFKRNGYEVTLGKGRNDGGIDIRVWLEKEDKENPPMILIQCKRQKEKVQLQKQDYDYLIGKDHANIRNIERTTCKKGGKIHLLIEFADLQKEVAGHWYSGRFDITYADVQLE